MTRSLLDVIKNDNKVYIGNHPCFHGLKVYKSEEYQVGFTQPLPSAKEIEDFYYSGFYIKDQDDKAIESRITFSSLRAESQFKFISLLLPKTESCKVLDVGCSEGSLLVRFAQEGAEVFGYEIDQKMAHLANSRLKKFNFNFPVINTLFNSREIEKQSQKFDVICSSHILEHLGRVIK